MKTIPLSISNILGKAGNAAEGLRNFKSGATIDLLITDLNMRG